MFSMPPATTTSALPARIMSAARFTALSPEPQTLFSVDAGTSTGSPAPSAACRATLCPRQARGCTPSGLRPPVRATPARRSASSITSAPSFSTGTSASVLAELPYRGAHRACQHYPFAHRVPPLLRRHHGRDAFEQHLAVLIRADGLQRDDVPPLVDLSDLVTFASTVSPIWAGL